jgi:hypothetical protein
MHGQVSKDGILFVFIVLLFGQTPVLILFTTAEMFVMSADYPMRGGFTVVPHTMPLILTMWVPVIICNRKETMHI